MNSEDLRVRIAPYAGNPRYWQYGGKPILLLGGSKTDHLFLLDDLESHLDEAHSVGVNYLRNTMSQREAKELKPYRLLDNGKFDLDEWNDEYWLRFERMLSGTRRRGIIVQIEVWDRFDFSMDFWSHSPWNPRNNVNYTADSSGLSDSYPTHPNTDLQPFFHTVVGMPHFDERLTDIRRRQEQFVRKMLGYSLPYPNVLYCMDNETSTPAAWGESWIKFIRSEAEAQGVEVHLTDMFDDVFVPEESHKLRCALENPSTYTFLDVSQVNSRNFGEAHWEKVMWIVHEAERAPRPINNVKIYGDGHKSFGTGGPQDGVERFVRNILAGCAAARFHRDGSGIGLSYIAKAAISAVRKLEELITPWTMRPAMHLLTERGYNQAYAAATEDRSACAVYFTYGGAVRLHLSDPAAPAATATATTPAPARAAAPATVADEPSSVTGAAYSVRWIDVSAGTWGPVERVSGQPAVLLGAPDAGGWIAVVTRDG